MDSNSNVKKEERNTFYTPEDLKSLSQRLNRIEGQIGGIRRMLERNAYCPDVLVQVSAAISALGSFSKLMVQNHLTQTVIPDFNDGKTESVEEFAAILQRLIK